MRKWILLMLGCLLTLSGCAGVDPPRHGAGHPASPMADSAPGALSLTVLELDKENLPAPPREMKPLRGKMHH